MGNAEARESTIPWGIMRGLGELTRAVVRPGSESDVAATAWACTRCGNCRTMCLLDNPVAETVLDARSDVFAANLAPPEARSVSERFGVRVRGPRRLEGSYRFRKFIGALAFDEVDGLTWEEREPMLRRTEDELREAWSEGRAHLGVPPGMKSAMMLGLRAVFDRKADAYSALASWCGGPRERAAARPVETADVCAPMGPADAPARVARIEADPVADEALASRVRRALAAAEADVARYARSGARSHVLLFVDDDYLCFSSRDESPTDGAVAIENVLSSRFTSATRRRLYGRLRPGARVSVDEGGLVVADGRGAAQRHPEPARLVGFTFRWA